MRLLREFMILGLSAAVFAACSPVGKSRRSDPDTAPIQTAKSGTMDGGGGPFADEAPASDIEIAQALQDVKSLGAAIFNSLENDHDKVTYLDLMAEKGEDFKKEFYPLLFPSPPELNVFQRLEQMQIEIQRNAPCRDIYAQPQAASAIPIDSNQICFSFSEIRKNAKSLTIERRVAALLVHEMIHKMHFGMNAGEEMRVREFEDLLVRQLPRRSVTYLQERSDRVFNLLYMEREDTMPVQTSMGFMAQKVLKLLREQGAWDDICIALVSLQSNGQALVEKLRQSDTPLETLRSKDLVLARVIATKARALSLYCSIGSDDTALFLLGLNTFAPERGFQSVPEVTLDFAPLQAPWPILRRPSFHNRESLTTELAELSLFIDRLLAAIQHSDSLFEGPSQWKQKLIREIR